MGFTTRIYYALKILLLGRIGVIRVIDAGGYRTLSFSDTAVSEVRNCSSVVSWTKHTIRDPADILKFIARDVDGYELHTASDAA
jgi:hypothetical protein